MELTKRQERFLARAKEWGIETHIDHLDSNSVYVSVRDHSGYLMLGAYKSPFSGRVSHHATRLYGFLTRKADKIPLKHVTLCLESFRREVKA